ncbi:MAG: multidrug efflux RND transporter permease subunit [Dokdonella sp.]|nr:multidrug efflux RND transporter permease subunit [Dokdonella sp.]
MSQFFIDRPVFAWVIAILISLGGVLAVRSLGIESYPSIAPPQVVISANYPGADAATVEKSVTQVIEQQLTGIDNLAYFSANSGSDGSASITITFEPGTNADTAQVQTQNKVALATPRLPSDVVQQGIVVAKQNPDFLLIAMLRSEDGSLDSGALNNLAAATVIPQIQRVPGVGGVRQFGSEYSMRIWLDADKLHGYHLSAAQALAAVRAQNIQVAAGSLGAQPAVPGNGFSATVTAEGRFTSPAQFENIILRANNDGTAVRLKDVARVELGPSSYGSSTAYNGHPVAGFAVQLQTGANALTVADAVKARLAELSTSFPQGVVWFVPYDTTPFIVFSIREVVKTLVEAVVLVFFVMLLFLQNLRMTTIALLVVPVALLGGFLGLWLAGFTINQLTLFGMVLVIGIVVDDAIVVIENVERIMDEEGLPPKEATRKAMGQISGAVVAIAVVLMAVFIPSALQAGSVGVIFRQFCVTIALSTAFSAFLALVFTPALCASLLKPVHEKDKNAFFRGFNRGFERMRTAYLGHTLAAIRHAPRWLAAFVAVTVLCGFLFTRIPSSFVPEEDQGSIMGVVQLPAGASMERTRQTMAKVTELVLANKAIQGVISVTGFSFMGNGENTGMTFIRLKPWDQRTSHDQVATEVIKQLNQSLSANIKDASVTVLNQPTIRGLGRFAGFDMYLEDRGGLGHEALAQAQETLIAKAGERKDLLTGVRANSLPPTPQLAMHVDRVQAQSMGLSLSDVYTAIQLMLAPVYANDFFNQGRVQRVTMQADAPFRMGVDALSRFYVPSTTQTETITGSDGTTTLPAMVPLSNVVRTQWKMEPSTLARYNGYPAVQINGSQVAGRSSGDAMAAMQEIVDKDLPQGFGYDWTGQSLQEIISGNQAPILYTLSLLVVFLCLAALYESWSIPVSVLLAVPLGVLGSLLATMARGLTNDVYFKIGIITIIGLAAKNAILIIEFAVAEQRNGRALGSAVIDAARMRMRPIIMTSLAFIFGCFPLAISSGAGANSRHAIGTGVVGGMLFATILGLLFIPVFYVAVRRLLGDKMEPIEETRAALIGGPGSHS